MLSLQPCRWSYLRLPARREGLYGSAMCTTLSCGSRLSRSPGPTFLPLGVLATSAGAWAPGNVSLLFSAAGRTCIFQQETDVAWQVFVEGAVELHEEKESQSR